jgi:predicted PurR-regulated permease PerM
VRADLLTTAARRRVSVVFLLLLLVTLAVFGRLFFVFFDALVLAFIVVALTTPAERWLRARLRSPALSMVVATAGIVVLVLVPLGAFGAALVSELLRALDGSRLRAFLFDLAPLPDDEVELLVERFTAMARAVFLGNGTASALQGVCGDLAMAFFEVGSGVL